MYIVMSVHTPHDEHRDAVIDSMHRFQDAIKGDPFRLTECEPLRSGISPAGT